MSDRTNTLLRMVENHCGTFSLKFWGFTSWRVIVWVHHDELTLPMRGNPQDALFAAIEYYWAYHPHAH